MTDCISLSQRFFAWIAEMLLEALAVTLLIAVMLPADRHVEPFTVRDVLALMVEVLVFFSISGYIGTTLALRLLMKGRWFWRYALVAPLLFSMHFEIMNVWIPGGLMEPHNRFVFRAVGAGVVLALTAAISFMFERLSANGALRTSLGRRPR